MSYPIVWLPSPKYTAGHPRPLIAIAHHRMVGTLASTDTTFTTGTRVASSNFGVGWCRKHSASKRICIHQYVRIGDQAWCQGNWDPSGEWDDHYPTTYINSRCISLEHEDGGNLPKGEGKGIVTEAVLAASIWLDRLLLRGNLLELQAAGIRFREGTGEAIVEELHAIPVNRLHVIDHRFVAGALKPYCWRPWMDDRVGMPVARYLAALSAPPDSSTPPTGDSNMGLSIRLLATRDDTPLDVFGTARLDGSRYFLRVRDGAKIGPFAGGTDLGVVQRGKLLGSSTLADIVAFNHDGELHILPLAYVTSFKPLPVPVDPTPYDQEDLNARIAPLEAKVSDLTLQLETASEAATGAEKQRLRNLLGL